MEPNAIQDAQQRVMKAIQAQGFNPQSVPQMLLSSYINGAMQSARLTAVVKFLLEPAEDDSFTPSQRLDSLFAAELNTMAQALEAQNAQPKILTAAVSRLNGH